MRRSSSTGLVPGSPPALVIVLAVAALALSAACAPKSKYVTPTVEIAPAFRENADWKPAQPADDTLRGNWWELFDDPDLNVLEGQIDVANQTLKAAEAQFAQARAIVRGTRATLFPTVDASPSAARARQSGNRPASTFHQAETTSCCRSMSPTRRTSGDAYAAR